MKRKKTTILKSSILPLLLIIAVISLGVYIIYTQYIVKLVELNKSEDVTGEVNQSEPTSLVSPTPYPITKGQYEYQFSWGNGTTVPKMMTLNVNPHDPEVGATQSVSARFTHTSPITSMEMVLNTDTQKNTYPMKLISGTNTDGVWSGSWTIPESHEYTYILTPMVTTTGEAIPYKTVIRELP